MMLLVLYPLIYIVSASFSSAGAVNAGRVFLFPVDFSLQSYRAILQYKNVYIGYRNTIFYTVAGTFINIAITMMCAYPLSRKNLMGRGFITYIFAFTMIFSGGMIPNYLLVKNLGIINTVWAMLLPNALSVYNMVVTRTFLQNNIPEELLEAAKIDGCSDTQFFFKIVLPLSKTIIAVIALFYGVGHWNSFFNAFLYLSNKNLYPLQIFLRQILIQNQIDSEMILDEDMAVQMQGLHQLLKYSIIVVSTAPLLSAYPLVQKHFVKGVMIGSIKG
ncbi:MAG TPA: carbohydrate ABC transporter permease [Clostridiaceae bacterium]|nr:carbohydrate ABC transporter permease [Clostridiaceae bacterium]